MKPSIRYQRPTSEHALDRSATPPSPRSDPIQVSHLCHDFSRREIFFTFPCILIQDDFFRRIYQDLHSSPDLENSSDLLPNAVRS